MIGLNDLQMRQLGEIAGIFPSPFWLDALAAHHNGVVDAEQALHHILYSYLHQIVDHTGEVAMQLRQALQQSMVPVPDGPSSTITFCKATLPETFRHLVQVEELLDVSSNARERLQVGPNNLNQPTPVGDQSKRCLKFLLSDGYPNPTIPLVGIGISPITNVSVQSNPGLKLLLKGPIDIRYGVLILHDGNCFVLGGAIEQLKEIQALALEKARRTAGVGVDLTVQALINHGMDITNNNDEDEEGYGESRDISRVEIPNPPSTTIFAATTSSAPLTSSLTETLASTSQLSSLNSSNNITNIFAPLQRKNAPSSSTITQSNEESSQSRSISTFFTPASSRTSSVPISRQAPTLTTSLNPTTIVSNPYKKRTQTSSSTEVPRNPYLNRPNPISRPSDEDIIILDDDEDNDDGFVNDTLFENDDGDDNDNGNVNEYGYDLPIMLPSSGDDMDFMELEDETNTMIPDNRLRSTSPSTIVPIHQAPVSPISKILHNCSTTKTTIPLVFSELGQFLHKLIQSQNHSLYESHLQFSEFLVPSKLGTRGGHGVNFRFSLEKIRDSSRDGAKVMWIFTLYISFSSI